MSYILEALKKSERERARGRIPTLETLSRQGVSRKSLWLGAGLGAGALLVLAGLAWLINVQFFRWPASGAGGDPAAVAPADRSQPAAAPDPVPEASIEVRAAGEASPVPDSGGGERRTPAVDDLGVEARRLVRDLSVNVVSYSEVPERRFVMLNQRIVREGESVGDGVVVKRITPEGALLSVGDYEVLIGPD